MDVNEITLHIYLLRDVFVSDMQGVITDYIDSYLVKDDSFAKFHAEKKLKGYVYDLPRPIEKGMKTYEKGKVYRFRIRTVDKALLAYLINGIEDHKTEYIKGLSREVKMIPHKHIASVHTLTPVILKDPDGKGYWRDFKSFSEFEECLRKSMLHQYEEYSGEKIAGDCVLFNQIELLSKCGIGIPYKGIKLLGDKVSLQVADNEDAQKVIYYTLAGGIGTMGSRGMGFLGYKFL